MKKIWIPETPEQHLAVSTWMAERINSYNPLNCQTVALIDDNKLLGAVSFARKHWNRVEICAALDDPRAMNRSTILSMLAPAFLPPISAHGLTSILERNDKRARRLNERLGFKHEGTMRQASDKKGHLLVYGLLVSEYIALIEKYRGKEVAATWTQYWRYMHEQEGRRNYHPDARAA